KSAKKLLLLFAGLLHEHWFGNMMFIVAMIVGYLHGWLKIKFRGALTVFAFDIPLTLALFSVIFRVSQKGSVFPKERMSTVLQALLAVCTIYTLLPFDVPFLVSLSAFRGWCFIPLVFLLGYHLSTSVRQVEFYIWMMILMGTAVAVYGDFFQSEAEVREMIKADPELAFRFQNTFYAQGGHAVFRRFGTYVSAAQFGGSSAYCLLFAFSRLTVKSCPLYERIVLSLCCLPLAFAVILSGSRTSLALMMIALAFTTWYRRGSFLLLLAPVFMVIVVKAGSALTGGVSSDRFNTLFDKDTVGGRFSIVFEPAMDAIQEFPMGGGLGRSGHGVPMILMNILGHFDMHPVDGDLGRIIVEMGIVGAAVLLAMVWVGIGDSYKWMATLRNTPLGIIGLPAGIYFILAVTSIPTGSPFLGIPTGALLWFFLGALSRLTSDYEIALKTQGAAADIDERFVSFISPKKIAGLYQGATEMAGSAMPVVRSRIAIRNQARRPSSKSGKRFLYRKSYDDQD
ncbi:MAG TPA: hypothetical protein VMF06_00285, partial [Candidatus Limnocylindria bacterium]|nr:hypothetical protein [Candidatus Limnocylindria bacterium]